MDAQRRVGRRGFYPRDVLTDRKRRVTANGVRRRRPGAACPQTLSVQLRYVLDGGTAAVFTSELDRSRPLLARVADRVAHHSQVGRPVEPDRELEPLRLRHAFAVQKSLSELVFDMQIR